MTAQTLPIHPLVISRGMMHHCWAKVGVKAHEPICRVPDIIDNCGYRLILFDTIHSDAGQGDIGYSFVNSNQASGFTHQVTTWSPQRRRDSGIQINTQIVVAVITSCRSRLVDSTSSSIRAGVTGVGSIPTSCRFCSIFSFWTLHYSFVHRS